MIHVIGHIPRISEAVSWYRSLGPLAHLARHQHIRFSLVDKVDITHPPFADIAYFQRPDCAEDIEKMDLFRNMGVPCVVDWDDHPYAVTDSNPWCFHYATNDVRAAIWNGLMRADVITVSTPFIQREFKKHFPDKKIYVVPNALDERLHRGQKKEENTAKKFLWRGTPSHMGDLLEFKPDYELLIKEWEDSSGPKFTFFGTNPWFINGQIEAMKPEPHLLNYFMVLYSLPHQFGVITLSENTFNHSKSNIAWLEMAWAGKIVLAPRWEEWTKPGVITYETKEEFFKQAMWMWNLSEASIKELKHLAWAGIDAQFMLKTVNEKRLRVYEALAGKGPWPAET